MTGKRFIQSRHFCIDKVKKRQTEYWDDVISWQELCDLLNSLYENVDTDKQRLLLKIDELEKENKKLNYDLDRVYGKIGEILNDREL